MCVHVLLMLMQINTVVTQMKTRNQQGTIIQVSIFIAFVVIQLIREWHSGSLGPLLFSPWF
jgi:hypothetical protein